jgi:hypothetical protein
VACYLRAWGAVFDVDAFLAGSSLTWDPIWRKGERKRLRPSSAPEHHQDSGVTTLAGAGDEFSAQVEVVMAFLEAHRSELARLVESPGLEKALLDFGVHWDDDSAARFFRFPPELLQLIAALGFELELSVYDARHGDGTQD